MIVTTLHNPEERLWRTDLRTGRRVYVLLSNDVTKPSEDDPMIGAMETSTIAENVVNTHNGALALYGRRYPQILADAEINPPDNPKKEVHFKFDSTEMDRAEHAQLLAVVRWLHNGPLGSSPGVFKLYKALGGEDER